MAVEPRAEEAPIGFNSDIRPILSTKCLHCHGPDSAARQADLRLDDEMRAKEVRDGKQAIAPGRPDQSELVRRILSQDADERMPPPSEKRQLGPDEIKLLKRWVEQGAKYEKHWSFIPPTRPQVPLLQDAASAHNPVDAFVLARLEKEHLTPASPAQPATLLRRLSLDLTGLPPSPAEVDVFLGDSSPDAYERQVDRLLASHHCGERLALDWLDGARFADSGGYQGDIFRSMWPWRDWVINAFNRNQPFDQFTIEQLAGDLLENPTREQLVATGFNRNHRINDEDGIILEEFRVEYVVDRVETTAAVWMGLTMGCGRCHDHKYDPISQRDFYSFYAFFNSVNEQGRGHGNAPPILSLPSREQEEQLAAASGELAVFQQKLKEIPAGEPNEKQRQDLTAAVAAAQKKKDALAAAVPVTMIMQELPAPRETFILTRGAYDKPGEKVVVGVPGILPPLPAGVSANRLGLARWLMEPGHPLTSRVLANRYWQLLFGNGLVATPEDFGTQGQPPTHPELLDWLAMEFSGQNGSLTPGWDVKKLLREMVTSSTYRQSSGGTAELFRLDPENKLLARGPRFRMSAELLRDQALAASGLLTGKLGGPSVRPYQPEGLWKDLVSAHVEYDQSHGADLYRRSMYTFWRRTVPPPAMTAIDAPNRELCTVRRPRTNTPLQALALMNDPTYVEAGRALAERVLRESPRDAAARLDLMFRLVLARKASDREMDALQRNLGDYQQRYAAKPADAKLLLSVGESKLGEGLPAEEVAPYAAIAMILLNLDEAVTKE